MICDPFIPGTVKPEADYEEFSRLGAKLGLPSPQAHVRLESRDADGNLVDLYDDRSRTLNRNYWNWLFKLFAGFISADGTNSIAMAASTTFAAGELTNKQTNGTVTNTSATAFGNPPGRVANATDSTAGIVVGTGSGAESFNGFALDTQIASGNGAGQLVYNNPSLAAPSYNAGTLTWTWAHTRIFNNNSGGTIVIAETAIYGFQTSSTTTFMIMRDLLSPSVSVLNAGQLTVVYTFTLTFPA